MGRYGEKIILWFYSQGEAREVAKKLIDTHYKVEILGARVTLYNTKHLKQVVEKHPISSFDVSLPLTDIVKNRIIPELMDLLSGSLLIELDEKCVHFADNKIESLYEVIEILEDTT